MRNPLAASNSNAAAKRVIATLDKRIVELSNEERAVFAAILKLEKAGIRPRPPGSIKSIEQERLEADALLNSNGKGTNAPLKLAREPDEVRLHELIERRALLQKAIELGRNNAFRLRVEASAEIAEDMGAKWASNIRAAAKHYLAQIDLMAERGALADEWNARVGGGVPHPFPCAVHADRAAANVTLPNSSAYDFLRAARAAGLIE